MSLSAEDRAEFEGAIEIEIAEASAKIEKLEGDIEAVSPDVGLGRLTRLEVMADMKVKEAALNQARETLNNLNLARARVVSDPDFGICVGCEEPIAKPRLLALPQSKLCVNCAP